MAQPTRGEEGMSSLEKGRRRYSKKDYPGALSAFTDVINTSSSHILLTALDHRAATYEKLGQLQPALRDAKRMIDLMPETPKGYLRCGKILRLQSQNSLALKIYERGLKKVKIGTDNDRTVLQSMFNTLKRAQDPGKSLDPLQFLPLELAEMVCHNLSMRDRVVCLVVSKPWKRLLESSHKLWTTLDTIGARKPISLTSIKVHLRRSNYTLDHAVITMRANFDAQKMGFLTKTCKSLRSLELNGHGLIGDSLVSALPKANNLESIALSKNTEITITHAKDALRCCQGTLLEAKFLWVKGSNNVSGSMGFPRLEKLQKLVLCARNDYPIYPSEIMEATPNLLSLILTGWTCCGLSAYMMREGLRELDLSNTQLKTFPKLPSTIVRLILRGNTQLKDPVLEADESDYLLPLLREFDCEGTDITNQFITKITQPSIKLGNLRVLLIGRRLSEQLPHNTTVDRIYPTSTTVEELSLASLQESDDYIMNAVKLYSNVRKLDVSHTRITGVAVKEFVKQGIEKLILSECENVSGDAVDWARGQGVEIEFNFPSRNQGRAGWRNLAV